MGSTGTAVVRVIGYIRVSTDEQGDSGLGLAAQRAKIESECDRRGWTLLEIKEDVASGKSLIRPGMTEALAMLDDHRADVLLAAKLDRVSRSTIDFLSLLERAETAGWAPVILDADVDMTTPNGEFFATVIAAMARLERRLISARTKDALAAKRKQGVRLGRPPVLSPELATRIVNDYAAGMGLSQIARALTDEGIPTARGGAAWRPSSVQSVLRSLHAESGAEM